jgi:hypothetical protein
MRHRAHDLQGNTKALHFAALYTMAQGEATPGVAIALTLSIAVTFASTLMDGHPEKNCSHKCQATQVSGHVLLSAAIAPKKQKKTMGFEASIRIGRRDCIQETRDHSLLFATAIPSTHPGIGLWPSGS